MAASTPRIDAIERQILQKKFDVIYTDADDATVLGAISNVPQGTYRVVLGARALDTAGSGIDAGITPQLNASNIPLGGSNFQLNYRNTDVNRGVSTELIVEFPNPTNSFQITLQIDSGAIVDGPFYILEKVDETEIITTEWD